MYLPIVGAVTITCSSIKSKNFCIRMWIIKYIGIVVLNGIVIAKIRITWFDGTEVTMADVSVWIYIFWNMSHCKGGRGRPKFDRRVSHLNLCHTIQCHTPQSITQSIIIQKFSHAVLRAVLCGQTRRPRLSNLRLKKMIHEIPESCWNRNLRFVPKSVSSRVRQYRGISH